MFALPHLLAAALSASPPAVVDAFFSNHERAFYTPEGTQTLSWGTATFDVTPSVSLLRRAAAAPVKLTAGSNDIMVWGCVDWTCSLRSETRIAAGTTVELNLPVWGETVHLGARVADPGNSGNDRSERQCCRAPDRPVNGVLVVGGFARTAVIALEPGRDVAFEGIGDLLKRRPDLLDAVDAVLVLDPSAAPPDAARDAFVERGGVWLDFVEEPGATAHVVDWRPTGAGARGTVRGDASPSQVARAWREVSEGVATPPGGVYLPAPQVVMNAAAVAMARHPPLAFSLSVLFTAFVVAALSLWRARKGAWRRALATSALAFAVAGVAIAASKPLFVPREVRARLVAWVGPDAATEVGADAARPRAGEADVELSAGGEPLGVATLAPARPRTTVAPSQARHTIVRTSADEGAALIWTRPSENRRRLRAEDGALINGLDEPIAFWVRDDGSRVGGPLAPGARAPTGSEVQHGNAWEPLTRYGVAPHEERLLRDVLDLCRQDAGRGCGAALVRRADETLVVEVRSW